MNQTGFHKPHLEPQTIEREGNKLIAYGGEYHLYHPKKMKKDD